MRETGNTTKHRAASWLAENSGTITHSGDGLHHNMEDPVVPLERNLYGHPLARLLWERQSGNILLMYDWEKVSNWYHFFGQREKGMFSSVSVDDIQIKWKNTKHSSDVKSTQRRRSFGRTNVFPRSCILGMYSKTLPNKQRYCGHLQNHV